MNGIILLMIVFLYSNHSFSLQEARQYKTLDGKNFRKTHKPQQREYMLDLNALPDIDDDTNESYRLSELLIRNDHIDVTQDAKKKIYIDHDGNFPVGIWATSSIHNLIFTPEESLQELVEPRCLPMEEARGFIGHRNTDVSNKIHESSSKDAKIKEPYSSEADGKMSKSALDLLVDTCVNILPSP